MKTMKQKQLGKKKKTLVIDGSSLAQYQSHLLKFHLNYFDKYATDGDFFIPKRFNHFSDLY